MALTDQSKRDEYDSADLLRRLVAVGRALAGTREPGAICRVVRGFVAELIPFDAFDVTIADERASERRVVYCWVDGVEADASRLAPLPTEDGAANSAIVRDEALPCTGVPSVNRVRSSLVIPMATGGRSVGAIRLQSYRADAYELEDAGPLEAVADHAAAALENARLLAEAAHAERRAAHSREELARTFEAMADAVAVVDEHDRVVHGNAAFWELTGRGADLVGEVLATSMHADEHEIKTCEVCTARLAAREGTFVVVATSERLFGRHFEVKLNRVTDADGSFAGVVQVMRDVTALRSAEAELASRQAILDSVLGSTTDAIGLYDREDRLVWVNGAVSRFNGVDPASLRGRQLPDLFPEATRPLVSALLRRVHYGETVRFEEQFSRDDGSTYLLEFVLSPVLEAGIVTGVVGTARDITERRATMERAYEGERLRSLGQLAAGVAHDFNNLLASILGYAQLLAREPVLQDPSIARKLGAIEQAARDGAETVRRIQTFTRETVEWPNESIPVGDLLRQAVDIARPRWKDQAQATGRLVRVDVDPVDPGLTVSGNGAELREVMTNVVFNALDAMPEGGTLTLSGTIDGGWVVLRVRDTGHGIDEATRRRLFEPFFTTRGPQNSGLGLAVSYGIVRRHGGTIEVESEPDVETVFTIRLPLPGAERVEGPLERSGPLELEGRVLVVDDEAMVLDIVAAALRAAGADVTAVGSGRAAIDALRTERFDIVVTDLGMPDVSGWDVARAASELDPRPRVLLLTGWGASTPSAVEERLVERVLAKPIDLDDLVAAARGDV